MPFLKRNRTTIYYEDRGRKDLHPLLLIAPGGMNSNIEWWSRAAFNPLEVYANDFRLIAMDQRNTGQSSGPLDLDDAWGAYVDDQRAVLDHLGIERCHVMGCCIGCSYTLRLMQRDPARVTAVVLEQPIGIFGDNHEDFANIWRAWGSHLAETREDIDMPTLEAFGLRMWRGDFVLSVSREFVRSTTTPVLVLPGIDRVHPNAIGHEIAELVPNAELMDPWKDTPEHIQQCVERVRDFLRAHTPGQSAVSLPGSTD